MKAVGRILFWLVLYSALGFHEFFWTVGGGGGSSS
jgi:hypothetical protein